MRTHKTLQIKKRSIVVGFVLALVLVVLSFFAVQDGSLRLTGAAIMESGSQQNETTVNAVLEDSATSVQDSIPTVVENRMTEEAKEAAETVKALGTGEASYYGAGFAGRPTANGERFNPAEMTAAHRTLPFGSKLRVTNTTNGRSVVVRVNDRGPYAHNRVIDLSQGAAERIGMVHSGTANVKLELIA